MSFLFSKRKHVVDSRGNLLDSPRTVDHYLNPKKKKWKPILIFVSLVVIAILTWVGANAYGAFKKIVQKNNSGSAPFLDFFNNVTPDKLKGEGDGRINILLLGIGGADHPGGMLTDTIQIVSIDPNNNKIATMSLPRDLYVEVPDYGGTKINQVYSIGESEGEGQGAELMKSIVSEILDLPIHYYVKMDFLGFEKLINEVGGIDINVSEELYDPYYPAEDMIGYDPFYIDAGQQHMDGNIALKYARSRETTSDFDRSRRQQEILIALRDKVMNAGILANPSTFTGMLQVLGDHLRTDIQLKEMERLAELMKKVDTSNILSKVLDNSTNGPLVDGMISGGYYLTTKTGDWSEVQKIAHELFTDPYLAEENARLELLNGTNTSGVAKQISDTLISYGYNVVNLDMAPKNFPKTTLYDYSNGKYPYTVKFLSERYAAEVITQPSFSKSGIDISLIIGENYLND